MRALVPVEQVGGGSQVLYDNGSAFLFVTGACDYYIVWQSGRFADLRTGRLDDERWLVDGLRLWHVIDEPGRQYSGDWFDGTTLQLSALGRTVSCHRGCEGGNVPGWLNDARSFMQTEFPDLYDRSESLELPQRIQVVRHGSGVGTPIYQWPEPDWDPGLIAISELESQRLPFGSGLLVQEPQATAFRALRRQVSMLLQPPVSIYTWHTEETAVPEYRLYIRDAIPIESDRGIVEFP